MSSIYAKLDEFIKRRIKIEEEDIDGFDKPFMVNRIIHDARPIYQHYHQLRNEGERNTTLKKILDFICSYDSFSNTRIKNIENKYQQLIQGKTKE